MATPAFSHRDWAHDELLTWLSKSGLTRKGSDYDKANEGSSLFGVSDDELLGMPAHRAEAKTRKQLKDLRDAAETRRGRLDDPARWSAIWNEVRNPKEAVRQLDIAKIPADAIAFYRPFHWEPFDQWGIYLLVPRLLRYLSGLERSLGRLQAFPKPVTASMVLFDVFHHEFFHHIVECTATTLEVIWPAPDRAPFPIYLEYFRDKWTKALEVHPHDPLEEALANAYAFNSFSFVSRVRTGYLDGVCRIYQKALERTWHTEPPGYREAGSYTKGGQLYGARLLLQRMLSTAGACQDLPIGMLVDAVFPRGHTAFWQKADIPTYLVGSPAELQAFSELVPAPNETYSSLFWPGDTGLLDTYIKTQKQKERDAKRLALAQLKATKAGQGQLDL